VWAKSNPASRKAVSTDFVLGGSTFRYPTQAAVVEAIENAVRDAESNGFSHKRADELSISFVDAVAC
jgi:hypothetical protein